VFRLLRNKYFWTIVFIVIISLSIMRMTAVPRQEVTVVENIIRDIYSPLQKWTGNIRGNWGGMSYVFSEKRSLIERIEILEDKNKQLSIDNQLLREYQSEAVRLKKLLEFKEANINNYTLVEAVVIARSPSNWYKTIVIDRGKNQGVYYGMPVITPEGLVGKVMQVNNNTAEVNLLTDREMAVGVILQRTRETNGLVEGLGDGNLLRMGNIPYYSSVEVNDRVITSGLSTTYPKGIDVGTISKISREPSGLLLTAEVKPVVDFDRLEEVMVIIDYIPITESDEVEQE
jgi:rod shape-determining protein MreC